MKKTISVILIFLVMLITSIPAHAMEAGSTQIISNGDTTFLIESDGTVKGWGRNTKGEVGNGTTIDQLTPIVIPELTNIKEIIPNTNGYGYFYAIDNNGNVYSWGYNGYGQLGLGSTSNQLIPAIIQGLPAVSQIVINEYTTYAINTEGDVYAWGLNDYGQVGNNTKITQRTPCKVRYLPKVKSITCKAKVTFALAESKEVYAWGRSDDFQNGTGTYVSAQLQPVHITSLSNVDEVITNGTTSFAICNNRQDVYSWGEGWFDELGTYSERNRTPSRIWVLSDLNTTIEELIIEQNTCFAITSDNTLYGWGANGYNQLGNGGTYDKGVPEIIQNIPKVKQFIFNGYSGIVLGVDNCVYSWGKNPYGEIGSGDIYRQAYAEKIIQLGSNIDQIYNGNTSMYASDTNGTLYGWGTNNIGQLGIGNTSRIVMPTAIPELTDITRLEKIDNTIFTCDAQDTVYGWGNNEYGQLGDGTNVVALSPKVITQNNFTTITDTGDVNSIIPIIGSINALTISVTHPANISYAIDPNNDYGFYTSDIQIQNNSKVPVRINIESFKSSIEGDLKFIDVLPENKDWNNLSLEESKSYIALGLQYVNPDEWINSEPIFINPVYALEINNTSIGVLAKDTYGTLELSVRHGLAFDRRYTAKHDLVFVFSLV